NRADRAASVTTMLQATSVPEARVSWSDRSAPMVAKVDKRPGLLAGCLLSTLLFLVRAGQVQELNSTGLMLGVLPEAEFHEKTLQLEAGDVLFGFTDGLADVLLSDGSRLGHERLAGQVTTGAAQPSGALVDGVLSWATTLA